ncbi:SMP-30/gluconolactonase/LRE family protein [Agreia bicolorata]|uniref:SMP-30/gluconolactonase/LRE family protein n=1 Tax=Agreia bicolorata TaxID=110935 RepID=UPI0005C8B918|nr:SMP-30/gluconolactonase/LRE family protein [Agreia bicolorata]
MIDARPAGTPNYVLSEGPIWHAATETLVWVDIEAGLVLRGELDECGRVAVTRRTELGEYVGCAIPLDGDRILVALTHSLAIVGADGLVERGSELLPAHQRLNDGSIDPQGRLVVGSLSLSGDANDNVLLRLETTGELTVLDDDLGLSNGLGWSPNGAVFYSTDTAIRTIFRRSYGAETIGAREPFIVFDEGVYPDGLTVDASGRLWVAIWGGHGVRVFDDRGDELAELGVRIPAPHSSSVAFAGPALDQLVITSASRDLDGAERMRWPDAGGLFGARPDARGIPSTPWVKAPLPGLDRDAGAIRR